jgi:hypothetical protein
MEQESWRKREMRRREMKEKIMERRKREMEMERQSGVIDGPNPVDAGDDMAGETLTSGNTHLPVAGPRTQDGENPMLLTVPEPSTPQRLSHIKFGALDGEPPLDGPDVSMRGGMGCEEDVSGPVGRVDSACESSGEEEDSVNGSPIEINEQDHVEYKSLRDLVEASEAEYADVGKGGWRVPVQLPVHRTRLTRPTWPALTWFRTALSHQEKGGKLGDCIWRTQDNEGIYGDWSDIWGDGSLTRQTVCCVMHPGVIVTRIW